MSQLTKRKVVSLRREWRLFDKDDSSSKEFLELCERMLDVGEFLLAHDVARAGLLKDKGHRELSQRSAFALSKAGSPALAASTLEELVSSGIRDVETLSLLASCYKDLCESSTDPDKKQEFADLAIARYEQGFFSNGSLSSEQTKADNLYYPCINVAFMHFICMNYAKGREYAEKARDLCQEIKDSGNSYYWVQATIAEAYLLLGEIKQSMSAYEEAVSMDDAQPSHVASTRKQALQICNLYEDDSIGKKLDSVFPTLGIVACSGHLIDSPGKNRRFPQEAEEIVRSKIEKKLSEIGATCGYSSAACGTDILFLEVMAERGGETHIFLPFRKDEFIQTSVQREGTDWIDRFEKVLDKATSVHYVTNEGYYQDDTLFSFCNDVMLGFTAMRGRGLNEDPHLLLFWDGNSGEEGGTGDVAESWSKTFSEPIVICANEVLDELDDAAPAPIQEFPVNPALKTSFGDSDHAMRSVKTMLFADVQGFTSVHEDMTPKFVDAFHGNAARIMEELNCKPAFVNSWGDCFFAVFEDLNDALKLAVSLRDFFSQKQWPELTAEGSMDVRISMHAGPVYEEFDPLLKKRNFFGQHVNQAARIEPIVLPGSVFVSETVAALISYRYQDFDFEYAGNLELAKGFGAYPVYILQRKGK